MSIEHHPARTDGAAPDGSHEDLDYWHGLIDERAAAKFLGLEKRTLQAWRQNGRGCEFIRISSRCVRYRRIDLRAWAEARLRTSTKVMRTNA